MTGRSAAVAEQIAREWYADMKQHYPGTQVGIANTGLIVAEMMADSFPLDLNALITPGGGQVRGMSGQRANEIIRRFEPALARVGTEAGRTSRGTPEAARELANRLNAQAKELELLDTEQRRRVADCIQEWLIRHPIAEYLNQQAIVFDFHPHATTFRNVRALVESARQRPAAVVGAVLQHLVWAKLELRFPSASIDNYSSSTADEATGRSGDFTVGDSVIHVTAVPSTLLIRKCRRNADEGLRPVIVSTHDKLDHAAALLEADGLSNRVSLYSVELFVSQNLEEIAGFRQDAVRASFRQLLEVYNRRVMEVEIDQSISVRIPGGLPG